MSEQTYRVLWVSKRSGQQWSISTESYREAMDLTYFIRELDGFVAISDTDTITGWFIEELANFISACEQEGK